MVRIDMPTSTKRIWRKNAEEVGYEVCSAKKDVLQSMVLVEEGRAQALQCMGGSSGLAASERLEYLELVVLWDAAEGMDFTASCTGFCSVCVDYSLAT